MTSRVSSNHLTQQITDHGSRTAIGGATTSNKLVQGFTGPGSSIPVPSILDQVAAYVQGPRTPAALEKNANTLFVLLGGGNDAFFGLPNVTAADSVANLAKAVKTLKSRGEIGSRHADTNAHHSLGRLLTFELSPAGGRYFLLASMPPLGKPSYPYSVASPELSRPVALFSKRQVLELLESSARD